MQKLSKREEEIMHIIWAKEKAFIKEIIDEMPDPKPHYNTIATIVKILVKKGVLASEKLGNSHRYFPLIEFEKYRDEHLSNIKKKFFSNSFSRLVAHFAKEEKLSDQEIEELVRIIQKRNSSES